MVDCDGHTCAATLLHEFGGLFNRFRAVVVGTRRAGSSRAPPGADNGSASFSQSCGDAATSATGCASNDRDATTQCIGIGKKQHTRNHWNKLIVLRSQSLRRT